MHTPSTRIFFLLWKNPQKYHHEILKKTPRKFRQKILKKPHKISSRNLEKTSQNIIKKSWKKHPVSFIKKSWKPPKKTPIGKTLRKFNQEILKRSPQLEFTFFFPFLGFHGVKILVCRWFSLALSWKQDKKGFQREGS